MRIERYLGLLALAAPLTLAGCGQAADSTPGKMDTGKMAPGKMDTGKMESGKMDEGKMAPPK